MIVSTFNLLEDKIVVLLEASAKRIRCTTSQLLFDSKYVGETLGTTGMASSVFVCACMCVVGNLGTDVEPFAQSVCALR